MESKQRGLSIKLLHPSWDEHHVFSLPRRQELKTSLSAEPGTFRSSTLPNTITANPSCCWDQRNCMSTAPLCCSPFQISACSQTSLTLPVAAQTVIGSKSRWDLGLGGTRAPYQRAQVPLQGHTHWQCPFPTKLGSAHISALPLFQGRTNLLECRPMPAHACRPPAQPHRSASTMAVTEYWY